MKKYLAIFLVMFVILVSILYFMKFLETNELADEIIKRDKEIELLNSSIESLRKVNSELELTFEQCEVILLKVKADYNGLLLECKGPMKK